jgi:hypothetical protein
MHITNNMVIQDVNIKILNMIEDGFAINKIANILNISRQSIKLIVDDLKIKLQKEQFNDDKIKKIIDLYQQGVSAKSLSIKFSIDKRRIQKWVKEKGILRDKNDSHRITFWNDHAMDLITSPEQAYWLGFCFADAYNCQQTNTFNISLKQDDKKHLEKFAEFLSFPIEKIKDYISYNKESEKEYQCAGIKLYSKYFCETMAQHGCPQAKSFIIKFPDFLNERLYSHFIRGLFDGDGSLYQNSINNEWRWNLLSTQECGGYIKNIINEKLNINLNIGQFSKTNNNTYCLNISGNKQINKLMTWLYKESNPLIRMDRKYNKHTKLQEQQDNKSFERENYKVSDEVKQEIINNLESNYAVLGKKYNLHPRTISKIRKK